MDLTARSRVMVRFLVNRYRRGERYGLGATVAFGSVLMLRWAFLLIVNAVLGVERVYRLDLQVQEAISPAVSPGTTGLGGT